MNEQEIGFTAFDDWLRDDSDVAALVMRQWLEPVEGKDAIIFPPTYTLSDTDVGVRFNRGEPAPGVYRGARGPTGYNIDRSEDGSSVCQIDSVGAQANRMEPIFLRSAYKGLVPEVVIDANGRKINLLETGHRAADAIVRFSTLAPELEVAFTAVAAGNASGIAQIAPTSLVFGAWDSRGTQVKLPRIVRSVIRAFNVRPLHRSAQYIPAIDYVEEGLLKAPEGKQQEDAMSELGLRHAPAPWTHGGILVEQEIRRDATLNLAALRALGSGPDKDPLPLRRYILGLSLVAFTAPQESFLREGCQLVPDPERPADWALVHHDGKRAALAVSPKEALEYARAAARKFSVGPKKEATFDKDSAQQALGQSKEERKKAGRRKGSADAADSNA